MCIYRRRSITRLSTTAASSSCAASPTSATTGWHTLRAKATDPLGRKDHVGAQLRFFADFEPPVAAVDLPAIQRQNTTKARVNCTDNYACGETLSVSIDGGAQVETTRSGFETPELAEGPHEIRLWAHDRAGNKQTSPTTVRVVVD